MNKKKNYNFYKFCEYYLHYLQQKLVCRKVRNHRSHNIQKRFKKMQHIECGRTNPLMGSLTKCQNDYKDVPPKDDVIPPTRISTYADKKINEHQKGNKRRENEEKKNVLFI